MQVITFVAFGLRQATGSNVDHKHAIQLCRMDSCHGIWQGRTAFSELYARSRR